MLSVPLFLEYMANQIVFTTKYLSYYRLYKCNLEFEVNKLFLAIAFLPSGRSSILINLISTGNN